MFMVPPSWIEIEPKKSNHFQVAKTAPLQTVVLFFFAVINNGISSPKNNTLPTWQNMLYPFVYDFLKNSIKA